MGGRAGPSRLFHQGLLLQRSQSEVRQKVLGPEEAAGIFTDETWGGTPTSYLSTNLTDKHFGDLIFQSHKRRLKIQYFIYLLQDFGKTEMG